MKGSQRFLLVTCDGAGNLTPELWLCRELVRRGHKVDVLSHDSVQHRIESAGCRFVPFQTAPQWDTTREQPDDPASFYLENWVFAREYADDANAALRSASYDAALVDGMLAYGIAATVASEVPTVALIHMLYELHESGPFADVLDSGLREANREIEQFGIGPFERFKDLVESTNEVLVFSFADFDRTSADVTHVGPLRPKGETADWPRLFQRRPLIVVGLSTAYQSQGPLLQRICDALGGLDVEGIVTTGPAIDPSSLSAPENVTVTRYVTHDKVLPESDLLMTHAGHGTVMAGIEYGVPMICVPMGADQPIVASRVEALGLGSIIDSGSSVKQIREAIRTTLDDQSIRSTCRSFSEGLDRHGGMEQAIEIVETLHAR